MSHKEIIKDMDSCFEIDPITRQIRNTSPSKVSVVQYDHNSERFRFSLLRFIEGHDMSTCNRAEVHYLTKSGTAGVYEIKDLAISEEDGDKIVCSWLLSQNATKDTGALAFLLRFSCVADDGTIEYAWNSGIYNGITVTAGMYNAEAIVEQYADILEQWRQSLSVGGILTEEQLANIRKIPSIEASVTNAGEMAFSANENAVEAKQKAEEGNAELSEHITSDKSHNDIRILIDTLTKRLNAVTYSEDIELDQLSEIVDYIKNNKSLIDSITTSKVNVVDIIDNLATNISNKPLSAKQGLELKKLIDALDEYVKNTYPNLQGGITNAWNAAKEANTKAEAAQETADSAVTKADNAQTKADSAYTLASGAGSVASGAKTTAENALAKGNALEKNKQNKLSDEQMTNIGKIPTIEKSIPTKVSELTNDSGYVTVQDVAVIGGTATLAKQAADNAQQTADDAKTQAENAESIAKGKAAGYVFNTKELLESFISDEANRAKLKLGDNLYIRALNVPDYWWDGSSIQPLETQKVDLSEYTKIADIIDNLLSSATDKPLSAKQGAVLKALIDAIVVPTKVSQLTNDSNFLSSIPSEYVTEAELSAKGYLTEHQDLSDYAKTSQIPTKVSQLTNDSEFLTSVPSGYAKTADHYTKAESDNKYQPKGNYLTQHQDISGKADKSSAETWTFTLSDGSTTTKKVVLA